MRHIKNLSSHKVKSFDAYCGVGQNEHREKIDLHDVQTSRFTSTYLQRVNLDIPSKVNPLIQNNPSDTIATVNAINNYLKHSASIIKSQTDISQETYIAAYHWITKCVSGALNYELDRINDKASSRTFSERKDRTND